MFIFSLSTLCVQREKKSEFEIKESYIRPTEQSQAVRTQKATTMTEVERRSSSTTEVKKDPFRYVPDIIDERSREVEGLVLNRYTKGLLLGKVSLLLRLTPA